MKDYVVRYHPEGWRDAKLEPPEETGRYWTAISEDRECGMAYFDGKSWSSVVRNDLNVTYWQPFPTPPWEIMP